MQNQLIKIEKGIERIVIILEKAATKQCKEIKKGIEKRVVILEETAKK